VRHPSYLRVDQVNCIIESIFKHNGIDPYTYHRIDGCDGIMTKNTAAVGNFVEFDRKFEKENNYNSAKEKDYSKISSPQSLLKSCFCKIRCPGKCNFKKETIEEDLMDEDSEDLTISQDDMLDFSDDSDNEINEDENYDVYSSDDDMDMKESLTYRFDIKEYGEIMN